MSVDLRIDPLDKIRIDDDTLTKLERTQAFALKDTKRMRNFFSVFNYCLNWGRGNDGQSPTQVAISPDFTEHSFGFAITTFRYDDEARAIKPNKPFFLMMYYRKEDDKWETHS